MKTYWGWRYIGIKLGLSHEGKKIRTLRVFENRVLHSPQHPVAGDRRRLHNEELHTLYSSSDIPKVIKSKRMR
jgi:hypothetical protein